VQHLVDPHADARAAVGVLATTAQTATRSCEQLLARCTAIAEDIGPTPALELRPVPSADRTWDVHGELAIAIQLIDRAYRHLSELYFDVVGPDELGSDAP